MNIQNYHYTNALSILKLVHMDLSCAYMCFILPTVNEKMAIFNINNILFWQNLKQEKEKKKEMGL